MACEVMAIQEPAAPMLQPGQFNQDKMAMAVAAQPYVVAMLVPAAMMMPSNAQVPSGTPSNSDGYTPHWGQEMWPTGSSPQSYGPMENFQFAPNYPMYGDDHAWDHDQRSRRRRRTRLTPKAPGMVPTATGRQNEDTAILSDEQGAKIREQLEAGADQASMVAQNELLGAVWPYSRHPLGCRLVQLAIQTTRPSVGKAIAAELQGHVKEATESPHANYVLQKVIEQMSATTSSFIAEELLLNVQRFARHRFGCRIVCRLVEHCSSEDLKAVKGEGPTGPHQLHIRKKGSIVIRTGHFLGPMYQQDSTHKLIETLLEDPEEALDLCKHNFGHHVVQSILEHGDARHKEMIAEVLRHDLLANASHRSSSYVVEAALLHCSAKDQESLVQFLVQPGVVAELAKADFGVFVVRTLLKHPFVDAQVLSQTVPAVAAVMNSSEFP
eukprot:symbB.v1.2.012057.t1/scaffold824.1/size159532/8